MYANYWYGDDSNESQTSQWCSSSVKQSEDESRQCQPFSVSSAYEK